jgi:hypothetical protein
MKETNVRKTVKYPSSVCQNRERLVKCLSSSGETCHIPYWRRRRLDSVNQRFAIENLSKVGRIALRSSRRRHWRCNIAFVKNSLHSLRQGEISACTGPNKTLQWTASTGCSVGSSTNRQSVVCFQSPVSSLQCPVSSFQIPLSSLQFPVSSFQSPVPVSKPSRLEKRKRRSLYSFLGAPRSPASCRSSPLLITAHPSLSSQARNWFATGHWMIGLCSLSSSMQVSTNERPLSLRSTR